MSVVYGELTKAVYRPDDSGGTGRLGLAEELAAGDFSEVVTVGTFALRVDRKQQLRGINGS